MSKKWDGKIPHDLKTGSVPHYYPDNPHYYPAFGFDNYVWKDNHVFQDILSNFTFIRGRSAAYAVADSQFPSRKHIVFLTDLEEMLPFLNDGKLYGMFTYCKRGQNFGTKLDPDFLRVKRG